MRGMGKIAIGCCVALFFSVSVLAQPQQLVIDAKQKPKVANKKIEAVHKAIENISGNKHKARLAILQGMSDTQGVAWLLEEEGPGYIIARFDYRGNTIIMKAEYNNKLIQLKYVDGNKGYECKNLVAGICYKNHRNYYKYTKNLVISITNYL